MHICIYIGSQNCFSSAALQTRNLHIFDENDFSKAWKKCCGNSQFVDVKQIGDIFKALFRGPVPPSDQYEVIN
jgi:hypothetical protein